MQSRSEAVLCEAVIQDQGRMRGQRARGPTSMDGAPYMWNVMLSITSQAGASLTLSLSHSRAAPSKKLVLHSLCPRCTAAPPAAGAPSCGPQTVGSSKHENYVHLRRAHCKHGSCAHLRQSTLLFNCGKITPSLLAAIVYIRSTLSFVCVKSTAKVCTSNRSNTCTWVLISIWGGVHS